EQLGGASLVLALDARQEQLVNGAPLIATDQARLPGRSPGERSKAPAKEGAFRARRGSARGE
ncbi:MAG TPA: hypothetical protein VE528_00090, partial [Thermoleophilaceae bacterium]|nr:hypothetical protein [Thermoleophilaceae bacterium]